MAVVGVGVAAIVELVPVDPATSEVTATLGVDVALGMDVALGAVGDIDEPHAAVITEKNSGSIRSRIDVILVAPFCFDRAERL
jgi:hypothetical protein